MLILENCHVGGEEVEGENVTHVPFDESSGKYTAKKNLITKFAKFENVVYLHDYMALCDGWYLGGDIDWDENTHIGGYYETGLRSGELFYDYGADGIDGTDDDGEGDGEWDEGEFFSDDNGNGEWDSNEWGDEGYGKYNSDGELEIGTGANRSFSTEIDEMVFNLGFEYWYSKYFALRGGYYYDKLGKISNPTFGIGLRFAGYGFDAGFTLGPPGHPLTNTVRFSLNMEF